MTPVNGYVAIGMTTLLLQIACVRQPPPVAPETSPPPPASTRTPPPAPSPAPPPPVPPPIVPTELTPDDEFASRSLDEINRESPLEPAFFVLDSSEIDERARQVLEANAELLRRYPSWVVTIEGHCDERGTAEYNLGLGERRAVAAQQYLLELGFDATRVRTVSYGKEFPFDPGHDDAAWASNRRAHFVITAK
jgi:peptidoglycan-associated lipoprotein